MSKRQRQSGETPRCAVCVRPSSMLVAERVPGSHGMGHSSFAGWYELCDEHLAICRAARCLQGDVRTRRRYTFQVVLAKNLQWLRALRITPELREQMGETHEAA